MINFLVSRFTQITGSLSSSTETSCRLCLIFDETHSAFSFSFFRTHQIPSSILLDDSIFVSSELSSVSDERECERREKKVRVVVIDVKVKVTAAKRDMQEGKLLSDEITQTHTHERESRDKK